VKRFTEAGRNHLADVAAHGHAACGGDQAQAWVGNRVLPHILSAADDDIENPFRQVVLLQDAAGEE
jgi:hypothetical protein